VVEAADLEMPVVEAAPECLALAEVAVWTTVAEAVGVSTRGDAAAETLRRTADQPHHRR
jgi:hypothetical protein